MVKSNLLPQSGYHSSLEAVEPHPLKRAIKSLFSYRGTGSIMIIIIDFAIYTHISVWKQYFELLS